MEKTVGVVMRVRRFIVFLKMSLKLGSGGNEMFLKIRDFKIRCPKE